MTAVHRYLFSFEPAVSTKGSSWHVELESLLLSSGCPSRSLGSGEVSGLPPEYAGLAIDRD